MVKVSNIKITELDLTKEFNSAANKNMAKCRRYLENLPEFDTPAEQMKLLPINNKFTVSFELTDASVELANALRRCLMSEMPVYSLDFDEFKHFTTTDMFILNDFMKNQIEYVPISQDIGVDEYKKIKLQLHKTNNTDDVIDVYSTDMVTTSQHEVSDIITSRILLCKLRPDTQIKIDNIYVCRGTGIQNSGKFSMVSNISYKIMDGQPLEYEKDYKRGKSSLVSNYRAFKMSYSTHRNVAEPKKIMLWCCDSLTTRLGKILFEIDNISPDDDQYFSDLVELETEGNVRVITMKNEYWTIANIVSKYCYLEDEDIKFVCPAILHPTKYVGMVKISHTDYLKIMRTAIKKIIKDIEYVRSCFG